MFRITRLLVALLLGVLVWLSTAAGAVAADLPGHGRCLTGC